MIREKYGTIVLSEPIHETLMQEFSTQELTEYKTKLKQELDEWIVQWPLNVDKNVNVDFVKKLIDSL